MIATILGSLYHHVMSLKLFIFKEHEFVLLDSYEQNYLINVVHTKSEQLINKYYYWTTIITWYYTE